MDLGRADEALASYERAIAVKPDFADAQHLRADLLRRFGRTEEALAGFDAAIAANPHLAPGALQSRRDAQGDGPA